MRIALVEDHDLTRQGIRLSLQQVPAIEFVGEANTGEEGLQLILSTKPDVSIIDIGLPGIDGIELTQRYKKALENQGLTPAHGKVLILTSMDDENSVLAAFRAGADSYCMKNISSTKLVEALAATFAGNSWIDPGIARIVLQKATKPTSIAPPKENEDKIIEQLTERELEVLQLIVNGCSNADIAERLCITVGTVKTHVHSILNKLAADDRTQAAVLALRSGLVS